MTRLRVLDLETTGFEPTCGVVEIGAWDLFPYLDDVLIEKVGEELVNPGMPIPPAASSAHHIIDADVYQKPFWDDVWPRYIGPQAQPEADVYVAHNAGFERQLITDQMTGGKPWICTWKAAMACFPEASGHSNQELRYWLHPVGLDRSEANVAHRAGPDAYVTAFTLRECLKKFTVDQLIEISNRPALLPRVNFGKHRGTEWSKVPRDYLAWVVKQKDMDENVIFTARHWLRGGAS